MAAPSEQVFKLIPLLREYARSVNGVVRSSLRERQCGLHRNHCKRYTTQHNPHVRSRNNKIPLVAAALIPGFGVVKAKGFGFGSAQPDTKGKPSAADPNAEIASIINEADRIYDQNDILKLYDYLVQFKDVEDDGILWRLARATCDKGKFLGKKDKNQRRLCVYEAFEYSRKALALNQNSSQVHKWYAILLDYTGEYEGTKQRISNAYTVKEHFLKAIELNPKDATSMYSVGYWCFAFADLAWYQRNIAAALFASPPRSSYQEALEYFEKAERVDPGFYSMNLVMLGRIHMQLGDIKSATERLKQAAHYPVKTPDDEQAHQEAVDLLKKMGVKV